MRITTRFCLPEVSGKGAGLGNELFGWAKAYLAARELGATALNPPFGRNPRQYGVYFHTGRFDWVRHLALRSILPCFRFRLDDYLATGEVEYGAAIRAFAAANGMCHRRSYVLLTPGMWGGFHAIARARQFVLSLLYRSRCTVDNLLDIHGRLEPDRLVVGVHIRRGDFEPAAEEESYVGVFNTAIPLGWYIRTCRSLKAHFGDRLSFLLLTDAHADEVREFLAEFNPVTTFHHSMSVCSDLLALAGSDLLVCSVSSFSMWGAFLSESPYLWYRPNLGARDGLLSIWGHEREQMRDDSVTSRNIRHTLSRPPEERDAGRGVPVDRDGGIPLPLLRHLEDRLRHKGTAADLLLYGVTEARDASPVGTGESILAA